MLNPYPLQLSNFRRNFNIHLIKQTAKTRLPTQKFISTTSHTKSQTKAANFEFPKREMHSQNNYILVFDQLFSGTINKRHITSQNLKSLQSQIQLDFFVAFEVAVLEVYFGKENEGF
jgi:hypothetical protein